MATTLNTGMICFYDGILESIAPTPNFTPVSGFPVSNLQNSELFSRCRTPDLTADRQLTWDMGTVRNINVFALMGTNASLQTQRRFRAALDSGFTSGLVQSGGSLNDAFDSNTPRILSYMPPTGRIILYIHESSFDARYIRWHQSDTGNSSGYQEWGIARVGLGWQPANGMVDWKVMPRLAGAVGSDTSIRRHEVTFHNLTRDEADGLQTLYEVAKSTKRVLFVPEPLATKGHLNHVIWCKFAKHFEREDMKSTAYSDRRCSVQLQVEQVTR